MTYFLDTSVLIDLLRTNEPSVSFIKRHQADTLLTSAVCVFELVSGIERSEERVVEKKRNAMQALLISLSQVLPFTHADATTAGNIYADLARRGEQIDDMDILIAASAMTAGAIMVTGNAKHFRRIKQLEVITPESA